MLSLLAADFGRIGRKLRKPFQVVGRKIGEIVGKCAKSVRS
jgi:hypothetical protein